MTTPLIERIAAACASAVITLVMLQSVALLGHPRDAANSHLAQARTSAATAR